MELKDKIEVWQKDLIDMSRRNTLLYYHTTGARTSGLSLPIADTAPLFQKIVQRKKSIGQADLGLPDPEDDPAPLRRLERLRVQSRDDLKERGVHTLYMIFGMLHWTEAAYSHERLLSPLILIPLMIQREVSGRYVVATNEDEAIEINPVLHEKLYSDFHMLMPTWQAIIAMASATPSGQSASTTETTASDPGKSAKHSSIPALDDALRRIRTALEQLPEFSSAKWAITPDASLGRFSFTKLVMREDLQRNAEAALTHPVLRRIAGEHGALRDPSGLVSADHLDERVHPRDTLAILDADSSQEEAIQAANAGQSFVLQGPPGAGKSQTIANIIAEALGRGRKVLFVSEKMAALEVVRKRLHTAALGEFLLDLHDAKRNKKDFISELQLAVRQARVRPSDQADAEWEKQSSWLERHRTQLNAYVRELHTPRFALQISAFEAHGRLAQLASAPSSDAPLSDVTQMTSSALVERRDTLQALLNYTDVLDSYTTHPWRMTPLTSLSGEQASALEYHFDQLSEALDRANEVFTELGSFLGEDEPVTLQWATYALDRARLALTSPLPPRHWLDPSRTEQLSALFQQASNAASAYNEARNQLDGRYKDTIYALDHAALLAGLTEAPKLVLPIIQTRRSEYTQDAALRKRGELDDHLRASEALLPAIIAASTTAARLLGAPVPETVADVSALTARAAIVATSPAPPKTWLDADSYTETRYAALEAIERTEWARRARISLETRYTASFFTAELGAVSARFRERYTSILRFLNPQYYLDCQTLRQFAQPGVALTPRELGEDALMIAQLHEYDTWKQERRADHARILGRYFVGDQTDWSHLRDMIAWTDSFHRVFGEREAPEPVRRLATGPATERAPLASLSRTLSDQSRQWETERQWIEETLVVSRLLKDGDGLEGASVIALAQALVDLHSQLVEFWQAVDALDSTTRNPSPQSYSQMTRDLAAARAAQSYTTWITEQGEALQHQLHDRFQGIRTDWQAATQALDWTARFIALYPSGVPAKLLAWTTTIPNVQGAPRDLLATQAKARNVVEQASKALATITEETPHVTTAIPLSELRGGEHSFDRTPLPQLRERTVTLRADLPQLKRWVACGQAIARCQQFGMGPLVSAALRKRPFPRNILDIFERRFYTLWLDAVQRESPVLANFSGDTQTTAIKTFRSLDVRHFELASARLANNLCYRRYIACQRATSGSSSASVNPGDQRFARVYAQLTREAEKKRHPSIREIVRRVGSALIELKPCWMMSPLSVSQFIETANPIFDLVIFDEASQVLTEDAIGAILRGSQLIVVGDEKQLPPTSFFAKSLGDMMDDDEDDEDDDDSAAQQRTESILKELQGANFHMRSLKWHYRSRHESLIAFSNNQFYGDQLITFPGPERHHHDGVKFVYVADGVYDRSGSRTNRREAERVVDELIEIVKRDQRSTVGVVAMSGAQQAAIREALDNRFISHPELAYLRDRLSEDSDAEDAFFVKNLESVQGDERDIIMFSVGYGRDRHGKLYTNFGPINKPGGERRLNVAVTRARHRMVVVSSIRANDLPPTLTSAGSQTFRRYLDFAERGPDALRDSPTSVPGDSERDFDSPFELAVYEALKKRGLQVDKQVGCSGYRIDLAIRDDQQPDRYLLGVECDGRTYHSSKTARDRDRLRQAHLEGLGWHIHRIWSSDWTADPNREMSRLLEALTYARMRAPIRHTAGEAG